MIIALGIAITGQVVLRADFGREKERTPQSFGQLAAKFSFARSAWPKGINIFAACQNRQNQIKSAMRWGFKFGNGFAFFDNHHTFRHIGGDTFFDYTLRDSFALFTADAA